MAAKLRDDLVIEQKLVGDRKVYHVKDPVSGDDFEFGEEEYFIIRQLGGRVTPQQIAAAFRDHFGEPLDVRQIHAFVSRLRLWGLIDVGDEAAVTRKGQESPSRAAPEEIPEPVLEVPGATRETLVEEQPDRTRLRPPQARWQPDLAGVMHKPVTYWPLWREPGWIKALGRGLQAIRLVVPFIPLGFAVAVATVLFNLPLVEQDMVRFWLPSTLIQHLVFGLITVNLASKLAAGATCSALGGHVPSFGLTLVLGVIPRFHVDLGGWEGMGKREMVWTLASPILAKLALFTAGVFLWIVHRGGGTQLPMFGFVLGTISLISLLLSANPLGQGDGYALVSALLEQTRLRAKAWRTLLGRGKGPEVHPSEVGLLRVYGLASLVYLLLLLGAIGYFVATRLEFYYEGTGVVLFLLLVLVFIGQIARRLRSRQARTAPGDGQTDVAPFPGPEPAWERGSEAGTRRQQLRQARPAQGIQIRIKHRRFPLGWLLIIVALGASFFIPYEYEVAGSMEIKASDRRELYPESPGVVETVNFKGGEWVEAGTVIASMSSYQVAGEVASLRAAIKREQAKLQELLTTPRTEEVEVAEKQYEAARARERFDQTQMERQKTLHKQGLTSDEDYDEAKRRFEVSQQETQELYASLKLVKQGPHPQEIQAQRAEIVRLQADLARKEETLGRTRLIAPIAGRLERLNLAELTGKYLDEGDFFTAIMNDRVLRTEILTPEADLPLIAMGDAVRLRSWAYPDRFFPGQVVGIEPVAEEAPFGQVIRVVVEIPNEQGQLKPGMTGYGKIRGEEQSLIVAFTHRLVRFVTVEIWSWIP